MLTLTLALCLATAPTDGSGNPNPWEEVTRDGDLVVWTRDIPGARVREVKAQATIAAEAKRVFEVLADVDRYVEFMPYVEESFKVGDWDKGIYEYQRINPPLVDRRDYTLKVTLERDEAGGVYKRSWVEAPDKGPALREGVVRVPINRGTWTMEAAAGGKTRLTYYLYTDPGGSLPAWIANKANTTSVPDLIRAVKMRAQNGSWKRN